MFRKFGVPHIFVFLSAIEIRWIELLIMVKKILDEEDIFKENISEWKNNLLNEILSRLHDISIKALIKIWIFINGSFSSKKIIRFFYLPNWISTAWLSTYSYNDNVVIQYTYIYRHMKVFITLLMNLLLSNNEIIK